MLKRRGPPVPMWKTERENTRLTRRSSLTSPGRAMKTLKPSCASSCPVGRVQDGGGRCSRSVLGPRRSPRVGHPGRVAVLVRVDATGGIDLRMPGAVAVAVAAGDHVRVVHLSRTLAEAGSTTPQIGPSGCGARIGPICWPCATLWATDAGRGPRAATARCPPRPSRQRSRPQYTTVPSRRRLLTGKLRPSLHTLSKDERSCQRADHRRAPSSRNRKG